MGENNDRFEVQRTEPLRKKTGPVMSGPRGSRGFIGPKIKAKDTRGTLKKLWQYLKHEKNQLIAVLVMVFLSAVFTLAGPYLIGRAIDSMGEGTGVVDFTRLIKIVIALLGVYGLAALMMWLQNYIMAAVAQRTVRELRKDMFAKIQTLPLGFFDAQPHGELMSRLTNDIENINNTLTQSTTQIFSSVLTVIGALVMMVFLSPLLTLVSLIAIPLGVILTGKISKRTRKYFMDQQQQLGQLNGYIEEIISGQKVVKAFGYEEKALENFEQINSDLKDVGIRAQVFSGLVMPLMRVVNNLNFALVAGVGGWLAVGGSITVGVIASFLNYSKQFARPINEIANQFNMIQAAMAGAERVFEVMDETPEFAGEITTETFENIEGEVVFKDVTFGYKKDIPTLKNINLIAKPGETVALVGPTGAGKTTIINLLTRFYDVDQGRILIDGKDIRSLDKEELRSSLGIVLQDTYLFSDTVRENIRYGRLDATDEEVEEAARLANAHQFIKRLPKGYDTVLTEDGGNLSQGQKQLLTIARAILANPSILILDEATSNVDTRTEMYIQEAMLSLMNGRTSFVIAHRLSTIREADQILVIDRGEIIERGNHEELLQSKGFYYNLYMSQFRRRAS